MKKKCEVDYHNTNTSFFCVLYLMCITILFATLDKEVNTTCNISAMFLEPKNKYIFIIINFLKV